MSASLTHLRPFNSLRSYYQKHHLHKIQITVIFFLLIKNILAKKELSVYMEKKNIAETNQLMSWFRLQTRS